MQGWMKRGFVSIPPGLFEFFFLFNGVFQTNGRALMDFDSFCLGGNWILISHRIHVWYIYLHLAQICGKCNLRIQTPPQNRIEGPNPILRIGMWG